MAVMWLALTLLVAPSVTADEPEPGEPSVPHEQSHAGAAPTLRIAGVPERLVMPALGAQATIGAFDLAADRSMPAPQEAQLVAWYTFSSLGGGSGNVVLAGHRDWQRQRGIFYDLGRLQEGDEVWLQDGDRNWYLYRVVWNLSLESDRAPVEEITGYTEEPSLTLITCDGAFDRGAGQYVERRVVRAVFVTAVPGTQQPEE